MDFALAFEKAFGRAPAREELEKVQRIQLAFGVDDNDALMTIASLLVFADSGFTGHLQESARLLQTALREASRLGPARGDALVQWLTATVIACLWTASMAFVGALGLAFGAGMNRGHPCWVPQSTIDHFGVAVFGAPTGWMVLLGALVPGLFAGACSLSRGRDERRVPLQRWAGWAACVGISVALLSILALVLLKVPRG